MNQQDEVLAIQTLTARVTKISGETQSLIQKIADLTAALSNAPVSPEVEAALTALATQVGVVDDLVDDLPPPPAAA